MAAHVPQASSSLIGACRDRVRYARPVPSDIVVSQSIEFVHISKIAEDAGIHASELSPYGSDKAKVHLTVRDRLKDEKDGK